MEDKKGTECERGRRRTKHSCAPPGLCTYLVEVVVGRQVKQSGMDQDLVDTDKMDQTLTLD